MAAFATCHNYATQVFDKEFRQSMVLSAAKPVAAWLSKTVDEISSLASLRNNWDSYGAVPVERAAVAAARGIIGALGDVTFPIPKIAASPNGGVLFHWRLNSRDLEVEVEDDGTILSTRTDLTNSNPSTSAIGRTAIIAEMKWLLQSGV